MKFVFTPLVVLTLLLCLPASGQDVVISEIMYNTPAANPAEEWIELYNRGTNAANLAGWRISDGASYTFPNVTIPVGGYLVVAADVSAFQILHPGIANVVGGWLGTLSNNGEGVEVGGGGGDRVESG